jgi:uroporphyrinogen-III synthase
MFQKEGDAFFTWMGKTAVACIGPVTAKTAAEHGLKVSLVATEYTLEALTRAIMDHFSSK